MDRLDAPEGEGADGKREVRKAGEAIVGLCGLVLLVCFVLAAQGVTFVHRLAPHGHGNPDRTGGERADRCTKRQRGMRMRTHREAREGDGHEGLPEEELLEPAAHHQPLLRRELVLLLGDRLNDVR